MLQVYSKIFFSKFFFLFLELYQKQPPKNSKYIWNKLEYRPLEGYVAAITPFNFTAIGINLSG